MKQKIIGAKVRLLETQKTKGGAVFEKGTIMTIYNSFRGYSLKDEQGRVITRVNPKDVQFLTNGTSNEQT